MTSLFQEKNCKKSLKDFTDSQGNLKTDWAEKVKSGRAPSPADIAADTVTFLDPL